MRLLNSAYYYLYVKVHEHKYKVTHDIVLHYLKIGGGQRLIVCFSGFPGHYKKARYNYIRSLSKAKTRKLFILDDFGFNQGGSYYFGDSCSLYNNHGVQGLISKVSCPDVKETIFCGSSKGGTAALLYGLMMNVDRIIIGSPQYRIGDYLCENEYHKNILDSIVNEEAGCDIKWLNNVIDDSLEKSSFKGRIDLMYSSKEESYQTHIQPLIEAIQSHGIKIELHDELYQEHSQIGDVFSKYLSNLYTR